MFENELFVDEQFVGRQKRFYAWIVLLSVKIYRIGSDCR